MTYVGAPDADTGCVFCRALASTDDRANLVLLRGERTFLVLNAYPYTPGHAMAVLNRHVGTLAEASMEEVAEAMGLVTRAIGALTSEYRADGFNVGVNQGRVAGAGIADHLHVHVVPRWQGDTNFMPVFGEVRVLPEDLGRTYERLKGRLVG